MTCNGEAPSVEEAAKAIGDKVAVVGVAWAGTNGEMRDFVARHGLTFPSLDDQTGELFTHFGVPGQPAWVFVGSKGEVSRTLGSLEPAELKGALERLATR